MKIHLVKSEKNAIKGYTPIIYSTANKLNNIETISDNEAELILAHEIMDDFSIDEIGMIINAIVKKMRLNATLVIGGTDLRVFCKSVINGLLPENEAAKFINQKHSMTNLNVTVDTLKQLGLKIQSSVINGVHYEITAVRS